MSKYAEKTTVSSERSRGELERIIARYGADQFAYGWREKNAVVFFRMNGLSIRFSIVMPDKNEFSRTPGGRRSRNRDNQHKAWDQACRQRWRALALVVKAKLEAVESGITTFEEEFLSHILLPNQSTVGEFMVPQVQQAYRSGNMPKMLPLLGEVNSED